MTRNVLITVFLSFLIFTGCTTKQKIDVDTTPKMQVPKQIQVSMGATLITDYVPQKGGRFYTLAHKEHLSSDSPETGDGNYKLPNERVGSASLFADKKDLQVGDIIQILIAETLTNDSTNERDLSKSNSNNLGGGVFTSPGTGSTGPARVAKKLNNALGIGFSSNTSSTFSGSAETKVDEEFTTTISAIIEQTYQNGNYFIKGSKEMLINGEKQNIKISGVIRPYDITPENTVNSSQLANLKILYAKDGEDNDALKKGWGTRLIEAISPF